MASEDVDELLARSGCLSLLLCLLLLRISSSIAQTQERGLPEDLERIPDV
jgi:hypothetical protein